MLYIVVFVLLFIYKRFGFHIFSFDCNMVLQMINKIVIVAILTCQAKCLERSMNDRYFDESVSFLFGAGWENGTFNRSAAAQWAMQRLRRLGKVRQRFSHSQY